MAYEVEYENIINVLSAAEADISRIANPELEHLTSRIKGDIRGHINFLNVQLGNNVMGESSVSRAVGGGKLKKMLGRDLPVLPVKVASPVLDTDSMSYKEFEARQKEKVQDVEAEQFKVRLLEIYPQFRNIENSVILDQFNDLEIRGVAKWAGLPVSDFSPKNIDDKFITQIKDAMDKKAAESANKDSKIEPEL